MASASSARENRLRIVKPDNLAGLPTRIADPVAGEEVRQLTQQLVDVLIEMIDLVDGDPDSEPNGDEREDGDGI